MPSPGFGKVVRDRLAHEMLGSLSGGVLAKAREAARIDGFPNLSSWIIYLINKNLNEKRFDYDQTTK